MNNTPCEPLPPSAFKTCFTAIGFFICLSLLSATLTAIVIFAEIKVSRYAFFGLIWGLFARLLLYSIDKGISNNLNKTRNPYMLGEQLIAKSTMKRLIELEIVLSIAWLVIDLL